MIFFHSDIVGLVNALIVGRVGARKDYTEKQVLVRVSIGKAQLSTHYTNIIIPYINNSQK